MEPRIGLLFTTPVATGRADSVLVFQDRACSVSPRSELNRIAGSTEQDCLKNLCLRMSIGHSLDFFGIFQGMGYKELMLPFAAEPCSWPRNFPLPISSSACAPATRRRRRSW